MIVFKIIWINVKRWVYKINEQLQSWQLAWDSVWKICLFLNLRNLAVCTLLVKISLQSHGQCRFSPGILLINNLNTLKMQSDGFNVVLNNLTSCSRFVFKGLQVSVKNKFLYGKKCMWFLFQGPNCCTPFVGQQEQSVKPIQCCSNAVWANACLQVLIVLNKIK